MTRQRPRLFVYGLTLSLLTTLATAARADEPAAAAPTNEWRQWRGPYFNGSSDAKNLPDQFDADTNVRWTTALPGPGAGTPIVSGDRVFVTSLDRMSKKLLAMCVSRADGKILWS